MSKERSTPRRLLQDMGRDSEGPSYSIKRKSELKSFLCKDQAHVLLVLSCFGSYMESEM